MRRSSAGLPQVAQKVKTVLRFRAHRGGEVSRQSEWRAARLASPGAQKASPLPRFRVPQGKRGPKAIRMARCSAGLPRGSESVAPATLPSTPGEARSQSNLNGAQLRWPPQRLRKRRPCHASEHPRGGEVSKQSEWGAAPLASPGGSESVAPATLPSTQGRRGLKPI